jgi:hypothetical protein
VTWSSVAEGLLREIGRFNELEEKFPRFTEWNKRLEDREAVRMIRKRMAKGRAEHGLK